MLYPCNSKTRTVIDISGIWKVKFDLKNEGLKKEWYKKVPADREIAVPSSWNDLYTELEIHNHLGPTWYTTEFIIPEEWKGKLIFIRFGAVNYRAKVWLNEKFIGQHSGGFTPFEFEISKYVVMGKPNKIIVYVDVFLDKNTVPQGNIDPSIGGYAAWHGNTYPNVPFDFFPYGGIHRPVKIYCTNKTFINDITVTTDIKGTRGIIKYNVKIKGNDGKKIRATISDKTKETLIRNNEAHSEIGIENCKFWSPQNPYLYDAIFQILDKKDEIIDEYILPIGVRTIKIKGTKLLLNGKPIYLKGFGRHEDLDIIGKGLNLPYLIRDFNLMKWINANSFRTSHYPYSEEQLQMADRQGFLVIAEAAAPEISLRAATKKTLQNHIREVKEMMQRDKNHPSVIIWSIANENEKGEPNSFSYFKAIMKEARKIDSTRPISAAVTLSAETDKISQLFDLIILNVYAGWYIRPGRLDEVEKILEHHVKEYWKKFKKPILISEFGAASYPGLSWLPELVWSEDYHITLVKKTINWLRRQPYVIGEQIWNFADFKCSQEETRVILNRKGVFTRNRQPKRVAFTLKEIWDKKNDKY